MTARLHLPPRQILHLHPIAFLDDLCDPLPVGMTDPILDAPRTVLTPHMAWQTRETFQRAATMAVDNILKYFAGEPTNVANPDALKVSRPRFG